MRRVTLKINDQVKGLLGPVINTGPFTDPYQMNFSEHYLSDFNEDTDSYDYQNGNGKEVNYLKKQITMLEMALQKSRDEGFETGFNEALKYAEKNAKEKIDVLASELNLSVEAIQSKYRNNIDKLNQPILELAIAITEKIIGDTLDNEERANKILLKQIQNFLSALVSQEKITISINPQHFKWISTPEIQSQISTIATSQIRWIKNEELKPGECLVETEDHIIENVVTRQIENIRLKLNGQHLR